MGETILVGVAAFCVIGTLLALILVGASRGATPPVSTRADESPAPVAKTH